MIKLLKRCENYSIILDEDLTLEFVEDKFKSREEALALATSYSDGLCSVLYEYEWDGFNKLYLLKSTCIIDNSASFNEAYAE